MKMSLQQLSKRAGVLLAGLSLSVLAGAAEVRHYAAISLLGSDIHVVSQKNRTGSHMSMNERDTYKLPDGVFDVAALLALKDAVAQSAPVDSVQLLKLASASVFGDPDKLFEGKRFLPPAALDATLKQIRVSHLLLLVPHRGATNIRAVESGLGNGMLEGLGFYIDRDTTMRQQETGERRVGYLAPYVYFKIALINLATAEVERQHVVAKAVAMNSSRAGAASDPWEAMTTVQKVGTLRDMLQEEIQAGMPALIAKP